ncbi:L,D-transpeptidase family protein [Colwellia sp. TT2012]|uniref:L,D-transpeptidase family protein n=1 Tax=Colwellia sp. TT2012 TaxID=1720342 RepID=UPI00070CA3AC|nr:L,D-transpeptidase family protein [Colwellia sp. TT2012]
MNLTRFFLYFLMLNTTIVNTVPAFTFTAPPPANTSGFFLPIGLLTQDKQINYQQLISHHSKNYLWIENDKLNLSGISLLSLLNDLGINLVTFNDLNNLTSEQKNKIDLQLTQQLFSIATLFNGYQFKPQEKPSEDILKAVKNHQLARYVEQLLPQFDQVLRLRSAIVHYRKLTETPWPVIDEKLSLRLGQGHKEVIKLRSILVALADLSKAQYSHYRRHIFDPEVISALKKFQARHGLTANGKLTAKTIKALNTKPEKRLEIMQINLWRWLSLPSKPPKRYILVNIPAYRLYFIENQQETLSMKVIVGDNQHPTPIMVTKVSSVTINPQWTPTYNIVHKELLVENSRNPGSLRRQNFKLAKGYGAKQVLRPIFNDSRSIKAALGEYKLIQAAGKNNALGKYRFNIKNFHSVYLHDTPAKHLFSKKYRALSHGCVRLQYANLLAEKFMKNEPRSKQRQVRKALTTNKSQHIKLANSIAVYLTYQTVWLSPSGQIQWLEDIYQQDTPVNVTITASIL